MDMWTRRRDIQVYLSICPHMDMSDYSALVDINFTRVRVDGELINEEWTTLSDGKLQFILLQWKRAVEYVG